MSDDADEDAYGTRAAWLGSVSGMSIREAGPDADGPILELHGDEGSVAVEFDDVELATALGRAGEELAGELDGDGHPSPVEQWEAHNESFSYDPPEKPPEQWSGDDYTELYDRVIGRMVTWECRECMKPCSSLADARRHVSNKHLGSLLDRFAADVEDVPADDPEPDDDQTTLDGGEE